jgi:hypothetical protein
MSVLPESLRRVLAAQQSKQPVAKAEPPAEITTIWRDGDVWRQTRDGKIRQLPSVNCIT